MAACWFLYVLRCGDGTLYTGIALDVEARLEAHRAGRGARYTKGRGPLELVHREAAGSRSAALKAERAFKALPRAGKLARIAAGPAAAGAIQAVRSEAAPLPAGPYAQAVVHGGLVYVSGQLPLRPGEAQARPGTIEEEAGQALANLEAILVAAGSGRSRVLRTTVYLADMALWGRFNAVYAAFFGDHRPARTVVPTLPLHHGFQVEIDAVAVLP